MNANTAEVLALPKPATKNADAPKTKKAKAPRKPRAPRKPKSVAPVVVEPAPIAKRTVMQIVGTCAQPAGHAMVNFTLAGLSLSHLAKGVKLATHCPDWQGVSMAIGIDLLVIALEWGMVTQAHNREFRMWAWPALVLALLWSCGLNAWAFAADADGLVLQVVGGALGCSIPVLMFASVRAWASQFHHKA